MRSGATKPTRQPEPLTIRLSNYARSWKMIPRIHVISSRFEVLGISLSGNNLLVIELYWVLAAKGDSTANSPKQDIYRITNSVPEVTDWLCSASKVTIVS